MIEVSVIGVTKDNVSNLPIIILGNEEDRFAIPIWVGNYEAELLETHLLGASPPRPFPYDLICDLIQTLNGEVEKVIINDFDKGIYFAVIEIKRGDGEVIRVDSRPSDAINIAVRMRAPIFVSKDVIERTSIVPLDGKCESENCREEWERLINKLFGQEEEEEE